MKPLLASWVTIVIGVASLGAAPYRSPVAVVADVSVSSVFVAESGTDRVVEIDLNAGALRRELALPDHPAALALSADGQSLFVAGGDERGTVHRIDRASGAITQTWRVGHSPAAIVPVGGRLFVCCRFENRVEVLDRISGLVTARIPVKREPVAAALGVNGRLIVANHLPAGRADADVVAAVVSIIDTARNAVVAEIALPNGSTSLRGVAVSPDGAFAYVTHLLGHYQLATTQVEKGWMNTNALSVIDVHAGTLVGTVLLDRVDRGSANPWGVGVTADGKRLCVAHAGTHELSVIDLPGLHQKLASLAGEIPSDDLSFMADLQVRLPLPGRGPRALAVVGDRVVVAPYFGDALDVVNLAAGGAARLPEAQAVASIPLGPVVAMGPERRGELAFNDASRCFQHWQSCASCHPDGRTDGLNWDLLNDGLGNPKNTRNMLGVTHRSPLMALGVRESPEKAVRAGFRFIQFTTVDEPTLAEVMAYLESMTPVPSPLLVDGRLSASAERGRKLFESTGCLECHSGPRHTDLKKHDVGLGRGVDEGKAFVTPELVEVWRTAPYLHDGRAATLREVLTTADPLHEHNEANKLSAPELDDLLDYVGSL